MVHDDRRAGEPDLQARLRLGRGARLGDDPEGSRPPTHFGRLQPARPRQPPDHRDATTGCRLRRLEPGVRTSDIELLAQFELPPSAHVPRRRSDHRPHADLRGQVAFVTVQGMHRRDPPRARSDARREPGRHVDQRRGLRRPVGPRERARGDRQLDLDRRGRRHLPVSTRAQYKFRLPDTALGRSGAPSTRPVAARRGATLSAGRARRPTSSAPTRATTSSSSSPTGKSAPCGDVVAGQDPPRLATDRARQGPADRLRGPAALRRPHHHRGESEQSVLTRGYSSVIVNNATPLDGSSPRFRPRTTRLPAPRQPAGQRAARHRARRLGPGPAPAAASGRTPRSRSRTPCRQ